MLRLPNTGTYSLELVTAQNGAEVVVCYSDATATLYTGGTQVTSITSATTTTICSTPAASTVRDVDEINIKNTYAGSHTITVQLDAASTNYPIITAALLENESLNYTHGSGWQLLDAEGNQKITFSGFDAANVTNTPAGNISSTNVQDAINELDSEKSALAGATFTGDVGVGISPANRIHAYTDSGNNYIASQRNSQSSGQVGYIVSGGTSSTDWLIYLPSGSDNLTIFGNSSNRLSVDTSGHFTPGADNTQTNGSASNRWSEVFAGTGTINTSDAREKTKVVSLNANEIEAAKQFSKEIGTYKWLSAIALKGQTEARSHIGFTVQRAIEILQINGLDPFSYGFICYDKWETGDRYSFRYDELILFIMRGIEARLMEAGL